MIKAALFFIMLISFSSVVYPFTNGSLNMNITEGWNIVPQINSSALNFSRLESEFDGNITFFSYWNNTNQSYKSYVVNRSLNSEFQIPSGDSYLVYTTVNTSMETRTFNLTDRNYTLTTRWNLLFSRNSTGENISMINASIGVNASIISYWNNTNKLKYSAIPKFTVNHDVRIPFLESFWLFMNNETRWLR